jgi:hypothetical protein
MVGNMISRNASKGRMILAAKDEAEIAARKEASAIIIAEQGR